MTLIQTLVKAMGESSNVLDKATYNKLVDAVTEYDRKQMTKKGHNVYALAGYLEAVDSVEEDMKSGMTLEDAIKANFIDRLQTFVLKAVSK